mmetsp:Transcript_22347/g.54126  ORF Transcript_22347/g.54126 Transcript_22347/m.54126 type:complete len:296 (-) Transcript_22347:346-1233(-)
MQHPTATGCNNNDDDDKRRRQIKMKRRGNAVILFLAIAAIASPAAARVLGAREGDTTGSCPGGVSPDGECLAGYDSPDNDSEPRRRYELATDCAASDYPRRVHGRETWRFLQDAYAQWYAASKGRRDRRPRGAPHGFDVEFEVRDDGPRGRSVYAAADIPEGTRVYRGDHMVIFRSPTELVSFLKLLPHDLQCDVLLWAFSGFDGHVYLDMDEGSYINHGEMEDIITLDYNADTTREVRKGEEFLQDYGEYVAPLRSKWFNIIRGRAWKEGDGESNVGDYISTGAPEKQMHSSGR